MRTITLLLAASLLLSCSAAYKAPEHPPSSNYHYTPPAPPGSEEYSRFSENEFHKVLEEPLSTFAVDVDAASYSNVRRFITDGRRPPKDAVRIEEMINYFDYDYPQPQGPNPFSVVAEVSDCPWNNEHRLVHIGIQGKRLATDQLPPCNLVFLIDISGSMASDDKLPLLKSAFRLLVDELGCMDRVAIVTYASSVVVALGSTPGSQKDKILDAIARLNAGGSTAGGAGIQLAYDVARENYIEGGTNRVILATDGDFNVGVSTVEDLAILIEQKRDEGISLTVLGFGTGNIKDNKMELLADKGNGNYAYIDNLLEAKKILVNEFGATLQTIAQDVKLQVEFNPAKASAYRLIGYENRLLRKQEFADDSKDAGEIGAGHSVTALYEIIPAELADASAGDPLRYQQTGIKDEALDSPELMTLKLRYKEPEDSISNLIVAPVRDMHIALEESTDDFRFSAAVAEFGMLLRTSKFSGHASYRDVIRLASTALGDDAFGYRHEFIRLVESAGLMTRTLSDEDVAPR